LREKGGDTMGIVEVLLLAMVALYLLGDDRNSRR
jgi:hypothetical protein